MDKNAVIVLSGGMDSVTLLHYKKNNIALAVSFNYGSNHNQREIECAARQCGKLNIEHLIIPLEFIGKYFKSSLLEGAENIPDGTYDGDNIHSTVVPFRNGIMLSIACGIAESRGLRHVMIANHGGDHIIYPDCRPEFITSMSDAMKSGTFDGVDIIAPFTYSSKAEIASLGKRLGIDYADTYSCYKGGIKHCGVCATCMERKEAMKLAGIEDPTEYEQPDVLR